MFDRGPLVRAEAALEKGEQGRPLAVPVRVDQRLVLLDRGVRHRAGRIANLPPEVRPFEVARDPLERDEEERLVSFQRTAEGAAKLFAPEVFQAGAVRQVSGQGRDPLEVKKTSALLVRARLRDDVDDAPGRAAEFRRGAGGNHLELLDCFERDVHRGALPAGLFPEEPVVVVAAVEADVVEDPALPREGDLVAVGPLDDGDAGREREEVLELASEVRDVLDRQRAERGRRGRARGIDHAGAPGDRHRFGDASDFHGDRKCHRLSHRERHVLLHQRGERRDLEGQTIGAWRELQEHEPRVLSGSQRSRQAGADVDRFDSDPGQKGTRGVGDGPLDHAGRDLLRGDRVDSQEEKQEKGEPITHADAPCQIGLGSRRGAYTGMRNAGCGMRDAECGMRGCGASSRKQGTAEGLDYCKVSSSAGSSRM